MKTLWTFSALILATLYHGSLQQTPSQSSLNQPRILVMTGLWYRNYQIETELWPELESQCTLPNFPLPGGGAFGFWTAQGPTVCGKRFDIKCFFFKEHQWMPWTNMGTARYFASAIQINPNQALIIGGVDDHGNLLKTTELISSSGSEEKSEFPVTIYGHCSFAINATHALVTGGRVGHWPSAKTWFVDLTTATVTPGPNMETKRVGHGCSIYKNGTQTYGVVTGGTNGTPNTPNLIYTELLNLNQETPGIRTVDYWIRGPNLREGLHSLTLVGTPQGTYAMGGRNNGYNDRTEVVQLNCPRWIFDCEWKQVGNLQFARAGHVSIALPESYDICRA